MCRENILAKKSQWWVTIAVVLVLLRLVLVSHHEVMTMGWDSIGYVGFSAKMYWGSAYDQFSYTRVPTFPLLISLCTMLGVPFRLAEEAVLVAAACWAAKAAHLCGLRGLFSLVVFAGVLFEPWTVRQFNVVVPDGMYACFLLMTVCQIAVAWNALSTKRRFVGHSLLLGALLAITGTLRQEWPIAVLPLLMAAILWVVHVKWEGAPQQFTTPQRSKSREWKRHSAGVLVLLVLPCILLAGLNITYAAANTSKIGLFSSCDFLTPGYSKLHKALLSIPSERGPVSPKLQAPTDVRKRVYQVSPTMKLLEPWLEGECLKEAAPVTRDISPDRDEYGAWLVFGIRSAAFRYRQWDDAGELDRFFETAADEIRAAQSRGEIPRRWTPFSFVAPEWGPLLKQIPKSTRISWNLFMAPCDSFASIRSQKLPEFETALYDHVTLRRGGLARLQQEPTINHKAAHTAWWHRSGARAFTEKVWEVLFRLRASALSWLWWVPIVAVMFFCVQIFRTRRVALPHVFLCLLVSAALARFAIVVLLDASGVWAQPRYLLASVMSARLALVVAILFGLQAMFVIVQRRGKRK